MSGTIASSNKRRAVLHALARGVGTDEGWDRQSEGLTTTTKSQGLLALKNWVQRIRSDPYRTKLSHDGTAYTLRDDKSGTTYALHGITEVLKRTYYPGYEQKSLRARRTTTTTVGDRRTTMTASGGGGGEEEEQVPVDKDDGIVDDLPARPTDPMDTVDDDASTLNSRRIALRGLTAARARAAAAGTCLHATMVLLANIFVNRLCACTERDLAIVFDARSTDDASVATRTQILEVIVQRTLADAQLASDSGRTVPSSAVALLRRLVFTLGVMPVAGDFAVHDRVNSQSPWATALDMVGVDRRTGHLVLIEIKTGAKNTWKLACGQMRRSLKDFSDERCRQAQVQLCWAALLFASMHAHQMLPASKLQLLLLWVSNVDSNAVQHEYIVDSDVLRICEAVRVDQPALLQALAQMRTERRAAEARRPKST